MEKTQTDAVGMTRQIRDAHAEALQNATLEERIRFYREKARRLHEAVEERQGEGKALGAERP
jgi:hypothetical protein